MGRLGELLERQNGIGERESVAHSLGTLKRLETTCRRTLRRPAVRCLRESAERPYHGIRMGRVYYW